MPSSKGKLTRSQVIAQGHVLKGICRRRTFTDTEVARLREIVSLWEAALLEGGRDPQPLPDGPEQASLLEV
jgi:hypothetical protein